jgi:hypothetical protein
MEGLELGGPRWRDISLVFDSPWPSMSGGILFDHISPDSRVDKPRRSDSGGDEARDAGVLCSLESVLAVTYFSWP